jgi:hypothetical protein
MNSVKGRLYSPCKNQRESSMILRSNHDAIICPVRPQRRHFTYRTSPTVLVTSGNAVPHFRPLPGQRYAARAAFKRAARPARSSFLQTLRAFAVGAESCIFRLLSGQEDALMVAVT